MLVSLENKVIDSTKIKVGVLQITKGQREEDQIYSNNMTPAFENFMSVLASKVALKVCVCLCSCFLSVFFPFLSEKLYQQYDLASKARVCVCFLYVYVCFSLFVIFIFLY
jgi:hypothetical protein